MPAEPITVGVLALQGDFDAHARRLRQLGADVVLVRKADQLDECDALVIPGGESTAFLKLMSEAFRTKLADFVRYKPTFGTCAGAILLAKEVENPPQPSFGVLDVAIARNAYGRQVDSSIRAAATLKCWPASPATPSSSARATSWQPRSTPNSPTTPASTKPSSNSPATAHSPGNSPSPPPPLVFDLSSRVRHGGRGTCCSLGVAGCPIQAFPLA